MVNPRQALFYHLRQDQEVQEAVSDRVYQRRVPKGVKKPLIVIYPPISNVPIRDLEGVAYKRSRLQVTAMAEEQHQAEAAANAVINAVEGFSGLMAGELQVIQVEIDNDRQTDQGEVDEIHHHVDIFITYKEV